MNRQETSTGSDEQKRLLRRRFVLGVWLFTGLCILGVFGAFAVPGYLFFTTEEQKNCCWVENATPEWTAKAMGFQVPETATDRRSGFHTNIQYDVVLLAFTVTTAEADQFLKPLQPEGTQLIRNTHPEKPGYTRSDGFSHLGLPEPETFVDGMRLGSLCRGDAKTPQGEAVQFCTKIYAHEFQPGTTRIYLWASSDAPLKKPPA
ncbi:hypothetical protein SUDANB120_04244 [Streptomyces sp. enrichment culture]|uniref:hypothetical protein n=1 Tax=Streptomyces sp. enrichment culture TaxID=1795815 RepID=UPI003F5657FA